MHWRSSATGISNGFSVTLNSSELPWSMSKDNWVRILENHGAGQ